MAQQLAMLAASLAAFGARSPRDVDLAALVPPPPATAGPPARAAYDLFVGFRAVAQEDYATAAPAIRSALALTDAEHLDDHVLQPNLGIAAWLIDDDEHNLRLHAEQLSAARRAGALNMVEHALTRGFYPQIATGAWLRAGAAAAEALPLAAGTGHPGMAALPTAELALVAALQGDPATAERLLDEVDALRAAHPVGITDVVVVDLARWGRALCAAAQPATALHHLERIAMPMVRRMAALELFDVAVRADRPDVGLRRLEELEAFAAGTGAPAAAALVEHGRAVLGDPEHAEAHFERALTLHAESPRLPDRGRTQLAYGEFLRRARRRVDAREQLRAAQALFEDLGAAPLADRARQELRASGETARRRDASGAETLTPQERQVAAVVRQGLSNREVAAQLFVSPRTVDFHLRNIFSKLGVASRGELIALPLDL
jgi:DNA-binding CsgD family transcriptional regulator